MAAGETGMALQAKEAATAEDTAKVVVMAAEARGAAAMVARTAAAPDQRSGTGCC